MIFFTRKRAPYQSASTVAFRLIILDFVYQTTRGFFSRSYS